MDLDPELLKQLIETFRVELGEQLQVLTDALLSLEKKPDGAERKAQLETAFRSAHNIKGSSRSLELETIGVVAHRTEDLFALLREKNKAPTTEMVDACLAAIDCMRITMQTFIEEKESPDQDIVLIKLDQAMGKVPTVNKAVKKKSVIDKKTSKTESTAVTTEFVRISLDKIDTVTALSDQLQAIKLEINDHFEQVQKLRQDILSIHSGWQELTSALKKQGNKALTSEIQTIYTKNADKLFEVQNLVEQTQQNLRTSNNAFTVLAGSLQSNMHVLRLVPTAMVLQPLLRDARDIAKELGKQVEVTLSGEEIEMDRAVLNSIKHPLVHLVRNAIDHGIEEVAIRKTAGKSESGHLSIKVSSVGGEVLIAIEDDGRGIDLTEVKRVAIRKKLFTEEAIAHASDEQIMDVIFHPGFSTKKMITDLSGRGVGLDVVRSNLQMIKGDVRLETKNGHGTAVLLRLPLTLVSDRGMLVRVGQQLFAIPTISIKQILTISASDVKQVAGGHSILFEDKPIMLKGLAASLGLHQSEIEMSESMSVVVVAKGLTLVAFVVDEALGEREIVVKSLTAPLHSVSNVSGATLTGRGEVIIVLNPNDLVTTALETSTKFLINSDSEKKQSRILVVDDAITTRTLEVNALQMKGYEVDSAVDGKEAWCMLQEKMFDLLVVDVEMPKMNGFALTEKVKKSEKFQNIQVVIVTSHAKKEDKERGVAVGADAYIVKSQFETSILLETIERLL